MNPSVARLSHCVSDAVQREAAQIGLRNPRRPDYAAKRCTADPGPPQPLTIPGLQRIIPLRFMLRSARDTP